MVFLTQEPIMVYENQCSGRCKAIVRRIAEQVRAETEQWSQMQEMLAQVREEMDELQASRDFWETRAYNADHDIQSLRHTVEEWKEKALGYKNKVNKLQRVLKKEMDQRSKSDLLPPIPPVKQLENEKLVVSSFRSTNINRIEEGEGFNYAVGGQEINVEEHSERTPTEDLLPLSLGKQLANQKSMIIRRSKGNRYYGIEKGSKPDHSAGGRRKAVYSAGARVLAPNRSPSMNIGNLSPLTRQISRSLFGFLSPESSGRERGRSP